MLPWLFQYALSIFIWSICSISRVYYLAIGWSFWFYFCAFFFRMNTFKVCTLTFGKILEIPIASHFFIRSTKQTENEPHASPQRRNYNEDIYSNETFQNKISLIYSQKINDTHGNNKTCNCHRHRYICRSSDYDLFGPFRWGGVVSQNILDAWKRIVKGNWQ